MRDFVNLKCLKTIKKTFFKRIVLRSLSRWVLRSHFSRRLIRKTYLPASCPKTLKQYKGRRPCSWEDQFLRASSCVIAGDQCPAWIISDRRSNEVVRPRRSSSDLTVNKRWPTTCIKFLSAITSMNWDLGEYILTCLSYVWYS